MDNFRANRSSTVRKRIGNLPGNSPCIHRSDVVLLSLGGVVLGMGAAFAVTRFIAKMLYNVQPDAPGTFFAVSTLLLLVALIARGVPALRAVRVDPLVAIRSESSRFCQLRIALRLSTIDFRESLIQSGLHGKIRIGTAGSGGCTLHWTNPTNAR
jgi:hypothetical protein